jgi:type I restriction enzyme S subunit
MLVRIPEVDEQRAIAHILGTLDDKIELNRRMNETLEAVARAIFRSWFVDFDPVRAKAECRDSCLPKHLAYLFPDRFEDSELGEIPTEWWVRPFSAMVEVIGGGTPKTSVSEYWDGSIPWFSVVDASSESDVCVIITEKCITREGLENSAARLLPEGTTIISARGTVSKLALVGVPMTIPWNRRATSNVTSHAGRRTCGR